MSAVPERKASTRGGGSDMRAVGMSLGEMNQRNLAERRHKKGECPTCGNKTHKIGLFGKRTALTIEGSCLYGRCLLCYPVEGYARRPPAAEAAAAALGGAGGAAAANVHTIPGLANNNPHHAHPAMVGQVPTHGAPGVINDGSTPGPPLLPPNFMIETEDRIPDDATMVSGITMDHRLIVGARNWNGDYEDDELYTGGRDDDDDNSLVNGFGRPIPGTRPEPSVGGMDEIVMKPPDRTDRRASRSDDHSQGGGAGGGGGGGGGVAAVGGGGDGRPYGPPKRYASKHEAMMDQVGNMEFVEERSIGGGRRNNKAKQSPVRQDDTESKGSHARRNSRQTSPTNSNSNQDRRFSGKNQEEIRFQAAATAAAAPRYPNEQTDDALYRGGEEKHEVDDFADRPPWESPTPQEYALNRQPNEHVSPGAGLHSINGGGSGVSPRGGGGVSPRGGGGSTGGGYHNNNRRKLGPDDVQVASAGSGATELRADLRAMERTQQFRRNQSDAVMPPPAAAATTPELERARTSGVGGVARMSNRSIWSTNQKDDGGIGVAGGPPLVDRSRRGLPDDDFTEGLGRGGRPQANVRKPSDAQQTLVTIDDIPEIIITLDHANRVRGFQSLAELIMANGQMAKTHIRESDGVQILVESMWTDMTDASVMEAACELLFALTASSDGNPDSDMLVGDSAEGAVDALLITMQTHITVESIQSSGCGTLHCLASASSTNPYVPDGTLSGAVFTVVNAMDMHSKSQEVQEWGIRALYSQCMLSTHAESNKKNLAQSGMDGGGGMGVIQQAMETARTDLVTVELACRLYWSLAANEDVARRLMESPGAFNAIVDALERNHKKPEASPMMEAAFGALANLARVCENQQLFRDSSVIPKATQSINAYHYDEKLYIEACGLLGVLATDPRNFEILTSLDVVNVISKLMNHYAHNQVLQEEAMWSLVCLTNGSESGKLALSAEATIGSVVRIMRDSKASLSMQEMACTLIGSLCVLKESTQIACTNGAIDAALALLKSYPTERRIHEAVFVTLRNITSHGTGVDMFLKFQTSKTIMDAMSASNDSVTAQLNACCMLWNICAKAKKDPSSLVDAGAIAQVVKAMQTHMESGEVLEMACGALWCLIDQSDSRKKELLGCGAIDAVTCSLVMHPKEPPTLEKACGLLANVCTQTFMAEAIADSQGISMVVEAMTNNSSSMKLLELGTLVLRNMVLTNHEFAMEASNGISAVINCMKENPDAVGFQREACNTLWALAAQSEECKNKILALDGVTVLMGALEHNSCVGDVQDAARGAINQLALSGPM